MLARLTLRIGAPGGICTRIILITSEALRLFQQLKSCEICGLTWGARLPPMSSASLPMRGRCAGALVTTKHNPELLRGKQSQWMLGSFAFVSTQDLDHDETPVSHPKEVTTGERTNTTCELPGLLILCFALIQKLK